MDMLWPQKRTRSLLEPATQQGAKSWCPSSRVLGSQSQDCVLGTGSLGLPSSWLQTPPESWSSVPAARPCGAVCQPPSRLAQLAALPLLPQPQGTLLSFCPCLRALCHLRADSWSARDPSASPDPSHCPEAEPSSSLCSVWVICWRDGEGGEPLSNSPLLESVAPCSGTLLLLSVLLLLLILAFASMISAPRCTT